MDATQFIASVREICAATGASFSVGTDPLSQTPVTVTLWGETEAVTRSVYALGFGADLGHTRALGRRITTLVTAAGIVAGSMIANCGPSTTAKDGASAALSVWSATQEAT
jgi:hypothetical protein